MFIKEPKERKINWIDSLLICSECKIAKEENEFSPDKRNRCRNFKSNYCKSCSNLKSRNRLEKYSENNNLNFYLSRLYYGITDRIKGKKQEKFKSFEFDLIKEDLFNLFIKQNGLCAISNIEMTYMSGKKKGILPTNISVDRIDSNKGYTKENTQLVCSIINIMKSNSTLEQLKYYCKQILQTK